MRVLKDSESYITALLKMHFFTDIHRFFPARERDPATGGKGCTPLDSFASNGVHTDFLVDISVKTSFISMNPIIKG